MTIILYHQPLYVPWPRQILGVHTRVAYRPGKGAHGTSRPHTPPAVGLGTTVHDTRNQRKPKTSRRLQGQRLVHSENMGPVFAHVVRIFPFLDACPYLTEIGGGVCLADLHQRFRDQQREYPPQPGRPFWSPCHDSMLRLGRLDRECPPALLLPSAVILHTSEYALRSCAPTPCTSVVQALIGSLLR